ncbi:MAG: hypothetical protein AAF802_02860 [Planctomycetota bacterium]
MDENIFTEHVRDLVSKDFDNSNKVLEHLRRVLRRRLKTIGQWNLPPRYLDCDGESC